MYLEKEKEFFSLPLFSPLSAQLRFCPRAGPLIFPFLSLAFGPTRLLPPAGPTACWPNSSAPASLARPSSASAQLRSKRCRASALRPAAAILAPRISVISDLLPHARLAQPPPRPRLRSWERPPRPGLYKREPRPSARTPCCPPRSILRSPVHEEAATASPRTPWSAVRPPCGPPSPSRRQLRFSPR